MSEKTNWEDLVVGDFLHMTKDKGDCLYEVTAKGDAADSWILRARCYFGPDRGRKITLYKLKKEEQVNDSERTNLKSV